MRYSRFLPFALRRGREQAKRRSQGMPGADGRSLAAVDSFPYPIRSRAPIRNHRRSHQKTRQRRHIHRRTDHRLQNHHRLPQPHNPRIRQHRQPHSLGNHPTKPPNPPKRSHHHFGLTAPPTRIPFAVPAHWAIHKDRGTLTHPTPYFSESHLLGLQLRPR